MTKEKKTSSETYTRGKELLEEGDYKGALEILMPSGLNTPHFKTFECIGECLLAMERPAEAVLYLSAAAGLGNKQIRPYFLLATALIRINDPLGAKHKLEQALSLNPHYKAARDLLLKIESESEIDAEVS